MILRRLSGHSQSSTGDTQYPMPHTEDVMWKLNAGCYYTKIDLADAYNQINLAFDSQKRLALSMHRGVLLHTHLTFGIRSAFIYFQGIMDQLNSDLHGVAIYLDNLLVRGANAEEHLHNPLALLQCLDDNGLCCNLEKCSFSQLAVEYLGYALSWVGIFKGHKINAITYIPLPTNVFTLHSFLGSAKFYSKFIQNLSTLSEPLTRLTRKDMPWRWGAKAQAAFQQLKDLLCLDPVLAHFHPALQISISCDPSDVEIGVVLFHWYTDGSECPIANASKTPTD